MTEIIRVEMFDKPIHVLLVSSNGLVGRELVRIANRVTAAAKGLCPVDTGRLRASIDIALPQTSRAFQIIDEPETAGVVIAADTHAYVIVGSTVEYSRYVEEGTRFMDPQPYLVPALSAAE